MIFLERSARRLGPGSVGTGVPPRIGLVLLLTTILCVTAGMTDELDELEDPAAEPSAAQNEGQKQKKGFFKRFKDPEDGKFDLTAGGKGGSGIFPVVLPFNEPATGPGLTVAIGYFHPRKGADKDADGRAIPPTTTFGAAAGTTNNSWIVAAGHQHVWKNGKQRYFGAIVGGSINLEFYGLGDQGTSGNEGLEFNINLAAIVQQFKVEIGNSNVFVGGRYVYAGTDVEFDLGEGPIQGRTDDAGLTGLVEYDTRDNVFTPNKGLIAKFELGRFDEALGGDFNYTQTKLRARYFWPISEKWILGMRGDFDWAGDGAPFYSLSWVRLRGIPVFRYLGNYVVTVEFEPRYKIDDRWSVVAFTGAGRAATSFDNLSSADKAYNLGGGFRYLLARKLGLGGGIDIARGPEDTVLYITVGSAW